MAAPLSLEAKGNSLIKQNFLRVLTLPSRLVSTYVIFAWQRGADGTGERPCGRGRRPQQHVRQSATSLQSEGVTPDRFEFGACAQASKVHRGVAPIFSRASSQSYGALSWLTFRSFRKLLASCGPTPSTPGPTVQSRLFRSQRASARSDSHALMSDRLTRTTIYGGDIRGLLSDCYGAARVTFITGM